MGINFIVIESIFTRVTDRPMETVHYLAIAINLASIIWLIWVLRPPKGLVIPLQ